MLGPILAFHSTGSFSSTLALFQYLCRPPLRKELNGKGHDLCLDNTGVWRVSREALGSVERSRCKSAYIVPSLPRDLADDPRYLCTVRIGLGNPLRNAKICPAVRVLLGLSI